jgi:hypothetical protein
MKNTIAIIALFSLISLSAEAQKIATWKGGTPGKSTDWNCPTNWKEGRVPNEFSNVVIPNISTSTFSYPVIDRGEIEVQSLFCASSARLTVKNKASLVVLEPSTNGKQIQNQCLAGTGQVFGRTDTIRN